MPEVRMGFSALKTAEAVPREGGELEPYLERAVTLVLLHVTAP
jgi:hypothetical protein